jgi:cobalt-zinc-cadmium efflux system outer membrane protein
MNRQRPKTGIKHRKARMLGRCVSLLFVTSLAVCSLLSVALADQTDPPENLENRIARTVRLEDLLDYAYRNNPDIEAAREHAQAAAELHGIDTGYPDPQVMVTYYPEPIETRLGPQDWNATLSQAIPYPGKLQKAGEVATAKADIADIAIDKVARDVALAVKESFHELYYIQASRDIVNRQMELFDNLIDTTESAYAQDRVTLVAVINAHSHMDALQKDLLLLDSMERAETAKLNGLLNRAPDAPFGKVETPVLKPLPESLEEMYRLAETGQEDIQMATTRIRERDAELDLAHYQNRPDFKVGLFYAAIGSPNVTMPPSDAGRDALGLQFSVSVPLWGEKNNGRVEKARAERAAAVSDRSSIINGVRAKVRALYYNLERSRGIIALYEEKLLPQAKTAVDATETWFLAKQPHFSDFVEAQSLWYQFQLALAKTRADYGKDLARLERLVEVGDRRSENR